MRVIAVGCAGDGAGDRADGQCSRAPEPVTGECVPYLPVVRGYFAACLGQPGVLFRHEQCRVVRFLAIDYGPEEVSARGVAAGAEQVPDHPVGQGRWYITDLSLQVGIAPDVFLRGIEDLADGEAGFVGCGALERHGGVLGAGVQRVPMLVVEGVRQ
ncbi:hypothetical protein ACWGMA_46880 [Streptomyces asiaticus]